MHRLGRGEAMEELLEILDAEHLVDALQNSGSTDTQSFCLMGQSCSCLKHLSQRTYSTRAPCYPSFLYRYHVRESCLV